MSLGDRLLLFSPLICAILFFHFSQKGDKTVQDGINEVQETLQRYDPLKKDELLKEREKKIEELKTALQDECLGNSKERKDVIALAWHQIIPQLSSFFPPNLLEPTLVANTQKK